MHMHEMELTRCKHGVIYASIIVMLLTGGIFIVHPETSGGGVSAFEWMVALGLIAGGYPVFALLTAWQADKSRLHCGLILASSVILIALGGAGAILALVSWDSVLAIFLQLSYAIYQWMLIVLLLLTFSLWWLVERMFKSP